jgi:hypothetical protein
VGVVTIMRTGTAMRVGMTIKMTRLLAFEEGIVAGGITFLKWNKI